MYKMKLKQWLHQRIYTYGKIIAPEGVVRNKARLNKLTGDVEFVLWKAGEQGHETDFWYRMGYGWGEYFVPDNIK